MFYTYVPNTIKTRKRTTPAQLEILEGVFVTDKKPNAPRRKDLAKKLKMSPREVQVRALTPVYSSSRPLKKISLHLFSSAFREKVWFQNRRAKEKKAFAKKDPSPTSSPTAPTSVTAPAPSTAPIAPIATDVSPSPDIKTRKRTTPAQLEILEGVFVTDKKPNAPRRKELAKKLKMSPREVQVRTFTPASSSSQPPVFTRTL
jgi:hypothetical protein